AYSVDPTRAPAAAAPQALAHLTILMERTHLAGPAPGPVHREDEVLGLGQHDIAGGIDLVVMTIPDVERRGRSASRRAGRHAVDSVPAPGLASARTRATRWPRRPPRSRACVSFASLRTSLHSPEVARRDRSSGLSTRGDPSPRPFPPRPSLSCLGLR